MSKTDTYFLVQKWMLHRFPLINTTRQISRTFALLIDKCWLHRGYTLTLIFNIWYNSFGIILILLKYFYQISKCQSFDSPVLKELTLHKICKIIERLPSSSMNHCVFSLSSWSLKAIIMNHVAWGRQAFFPLGVGAEREPGDARLGPWTMMMTKSKWLKWFGQLWCTNLPYNLGNDKSTVLQNSLSKYIDSELGY